MHSSEHFFRIPIPSRAIFPLFNDKMSLLQAVLAALLLAISGVSSCSLPPAGCTPGVCARLRRIRFSDRTNPLYGYYFGLWNSGLDPKLENAYGGPVVSYEAYRVSFIWTWSANDVPQRCCLFMPSL